jgi:hypothetical protein
MSNEQILIAALNKIDTHGLAVEEASYEELVDFIKELKDMAYEALVAIGERIEVK